MSKTVFLWRSSTNTRRWLRKLSIRFAAFRLPQGRYCRARFPWSDLRSFPPSIAGGEPAYTVQVGNAGLLADLTGIPVICDFRSDDIMAGGEGAPLAPVHNLHIAGDLRNKGVFPVAFCNAGNTGNISVITEDKDGKNVVRGWESGLLIIIPIIWFVRIRGSLMMTADGWRPAGGLFRNCCAICLTTLRLTASAGIFIFKRRRNLPIRAGTALPKV